MPACAVVRRPERVVIRKGSANVVRNQPGSGAQVDLRSLPVPVAKDDWRRMGQERFLTDLKFAWKRYQAFSGNWEHEHCEFCFKKR